ncbi:MAG: NAD(+) synthase [Anaerolineae bacterium]|nr:NAD(+) synthase [Anaerolineae bacterium]
MKIALAQINPTVGDLAGNVDRCLDAIAEGDRRRADLVVLPEMAIPGYPPRDILYDSSFIDAIGEATRDLAHRAAGGPPALVGTVALGGATTVKHPGLHNAVALLRDGEATTAAIKRLLPAYDVFLEPRWFTPGPALPPLEIAGKRIGVIVCEDMWDESYPVHPPAEALSAGADMLVVAAAVPYRTGIQAERLHHARRHGCPLVHVNLCGANDELIFDGQSFALNAAGELVAQLPAFDEAVQVVDLETAMPLKADAGPQNGELFGALVLGIRDFACKNGSPHLFLGLSGGIDSSLVAVLAAEAVGPANVTGVAIPSRYTDPRSTESAATLARALGIGFEIVELAPLHTAVEATLGDLLVSGEAGGTRADVTTAAENAQARLRMLILMAFVNRYGGLLLNTSNKTELALGYGTLYGDLAGTLSPIGDLTKPQVYDLARWVQETRGAIIPPFVLERPPSAELKPGQVDPFDYPKIAPALEALVRANRSNAALRRSEHKRQHHGIILKVSEKAFGSGRMIPITRR